MSRGLGTIQQKVLLLLLGGLALGLSGSPVRYFRVLKAIGKGWREINHQSLRRAIRSLYASQLVEGRENPDGTLTLVLSKNGKSRALTFKVEEMRIKKPERWDGKWRVVVFDIPEKRKRVRDALRGHLRQLDFYELQKSVFIHPYPCDDEVEFLIELHQVRHHVRTLIVHSVDNELDLKTKFGLI